MMGMRNPHIRPVYLSMFYVLFIFTFIILKFIYVINRYDIILFTILLY